MSKKADMEELTNILAKALRHRIGSKVNPDELYASQYAKDAEILIREAQKVSLREHWNQDDKKQMKEMVGRKLKIDLEKKEFLPEKKYEASFGKNRFKKFFDELAINRRNHAGAGLMAASMHGKSNAGIMFFGRGHTPGLITDLKKIGDFHIIVAK